MLLDGSTTRVGSSLLVNMYVLDDLAYHTKIARYKKTRAVASRFL